MLHGLRGISQRLSFFFLFFFFIDGTTQFGSAVNFMDNNATWVEGHKPKIVVFFSFLSFFLLMEPHSLAVLIAFDLLQCRLVI